MINNWYYRFCGVVILLVVSVNLQAQSDSLLLNSDLKRKGFKLAIDMPTENEERRRILEKEQLQMMLSDKQFRSYKTARNCYIASIPMLSLSACFFILGEVIWQQRNGNFDLGASILSSIATLAGITFLISGTTLIVCSAVKLNSIAKNYNKQRHSSHFQNGLQLNFGLMDYGIGVKLRF